jgi:hypothetical protein
MKNILIIILLSTFSLLKAGNDYNFKFKNDVYDEYIKTVTLEINNLPTNFPVMTLNAGQFVMLKFDDLLNEERNFYYRIIHCEKDWQPSGLREIEFIAGFNDERVRNYEYSVNTKTPYLHYWQQFPNKDTNFKVSGNFLIVIYEDKIENPVLTRRLVITENRVNVDINGIYPGDVENIRYKQEMQVNINFDKFKMRNPVEEISVVMLQNEDWNNAVYAKPSFFSGSNLRFNKLKTFAWWGLAEYRDFDTRSLMRLGRHVKFIERSNNGVDVLLMTDEARRNKVHLANFDFNGRFIIDNFERLSNSYVTDVLDQYVNNIQADNDLRQSLRDSLVSSINRRNQLLDGDYRGEERNLRSDYTTVTFVLDDAVNLDNEEIYVLGAMNNWSPKEEYRLKYDQKSDMYTATVQLKQGYYNYYYGIVNAKGEINYKEMEGSWNETENDYQALVYYKGLGDIYDRVIGFKTYNSNSGLLSIR